MDDNMQLKVENLMDDAYKTILWDGVNSSMGKDEFIDKIADNFMNLLIKQCPDFEKLPEAKEMFIKKIKRVYDMGFKAGKEKRLSEKK
jgi:hypothetical protein